MYPAPLPHLGLVLDGAGQGGDPAPLPHLGLTLYGSKTLTAAAGSFSVSGQAASFRYFHLNAAAGAFVLTGKAATLKAGKRLVSAVGSFSLTGVAAGLNRSSPSTSVLYPGPFPQIGNLLTGVYANAVEFPAPFPFLSSLLAENSAFKFIAANAGAFSVSGKDAALKYGRYLDGEAGSFALAGAPAERDLELDGFAGSFGVSGQDALLIRSHPDLVAGAGAFAVTGNPAGFRREQVGVYVLPGLPGQFVVTGVDATIRPSPRLTAETGSFVVGSSGADLRWSGEKKYGKSRKRRTYEKRYVVEIDGEEFVVESPEEAQDLLEAAKATVPEVAAVKAKPPRIRAKGPAGPELTELVDTVAQQRDEIRKMFAELQQLAEIQRLLQEQDDEEAVLALL